jgi:hypothetical protein
MLSFRHHNLLFLAFLALAAPTPLHARQQPSVPANIFKAPRSSMPLCATHRAINCAPWSPRPSVFKAEFRQSSLSVG